MKITIDTEERKRQINKQYDSTIRNIKAKRDKLNKQEQNANKVFKAQLAEIDALERVYGNGQSEMKLKSGDSRKPKRERSIYSEEDRNKHALECVGLNAKDMKAYSELTSIPVTTLYSWRKQYSKNTTKKSEPTQKQMVLDRLAVKPLTAREVARLTSLPRKRVDNIMYGLKKANKITATKLGRRSVYSLKK